MQTSGLVVCVTDEEAMARVTERLARDRSFTLAEPVGLRLPLAFRATDGPAAERLHEWLRRLPGVVKVDVALVFLDPEEEPGRAH